MARHAWLVLVVPLLGCWSGLDEAKLREEALRAADEQAQREAKAAQAAARAAAPRGAVKDGPRLKKIAETRVHSDEARPFPPPGLLLDVVFEGQEALLKNAARVGNLQIASARDDTGADLKPAEQNMSTLLLTRISDYQKQQGIIQAALKLQPSARGAKTVSVRASIEVATGGTPITLDFPKIQTMQGKTLEHPELTAAGLELQVIKPGVVFGGKLEKTVQFQILAGRESAIGEIGVVDAAGQYHASRTPMDILIYNKLPTMSGSFENFDPNWTLRITLLKGVKVVKLPIELIDVELP
ncbi:MAG: hypothetical protein AB7K24_15465 [Gemmataceae bacterium]